MTKETALDAIKELPQNFELDELLERLVFLEKVEKGLQQLKNGNTVSNEKVNILVKEWYK